MHKPKKQLKFLQLVALFRNMLLTFAFGMYIIGARNKNVNCYIFS